MPDNNEIFSQTHEEHRRIFEELKAEQIEGRRASRKPRAVILLGQPGSMSDHLVSTLSQSFQGKDFVMIDEEAFLQHNPKYGHAAPEEITAGVQSYGKSLFQTAINRQMNLLIRDVLCEAVAISDTLRRLQENGYTSRVYVVSAHERESLLSLYQSYEKAIAEQGYGEKPQISAHDESYEALPETLKRIENEKSAEEIVIVDRQGQTLYRNGLRNNEWAQPHQAAQILEEDRNRAWRPEEISDYQESWKEVIESMRERGALRQEIDEADRVRKRCLKSIRILPSEKIAELNKVEENEIASAVSLLKNPRSLDNSSFKGYEASPQQNDTLDVLDQIKKNVQESKTALEKLKQAGLSPDKDITKNKIVRPGQFPNVKGAEVVSRTKDMLMLLKGRSLFIYELKRLELQAPALGQPGEKLDLRWPSGQEEVRGTKAIEREQHHSRPRSQQEDMR